MFNNSVSFGADGSMIIKNGFQTIQMGNGGMTIQNCGGPQISMNNNGMHINSQQNSLSSVNHQGQNVMTFTTFTSNQPHFGNPFFGQMQVQQMPTNTFTQNYTAYSHGQNFQSHNAGFPAHMAGMGWQMFQNMALPQANVYYNNTPQNIQAVPVQPKPKGLTKAQLNQLPVCAYSKKATRSRQSKTKKNEKNDQDNDEYSSNDCCPICIGDYRVGEKIKTLPCIHRFHNECIDKWLEVKSECPVCKYDLLG